MRRLQRSHMGICVVLLVGGCALPDYHQPRGFSSTYYRQLQQAQQFTATAPVAGVESPPVPGSDPKWYAPWTGEAKTPDPAVMK